MANQYRDVDLFINTVNDQAAYKQMLAKFNLHEFISLQCWPSLHQNLRQQLFVWLFRPCMQSLKLLVKYENSLPLAMGQLHYLYSGLISIGYIIEIPRNSNTELTATYISSTYGKPLGKILEIEELPALEHLLNGQHLSVFSMGNCQIVASINKEMADFIKS